MIKIMIFFYKFCDNKHAAPFYTQSLDRISGGRTCLQSSGMKFETSRNYVTRNFRHLVILLY